jgi:predicted RNase H-like HicB family nuclease
MSAKVPTPELLVGFSVTAFCAGLQEETQSGFLTPRKDAARREDGRWRIAIPGRVLAPQMAPLGFQQRQETPVRTLRPKVFTVMATWDADAGVWVATSQDVPGLATEAETVEILEQKLKVMIPELLEANSIDLDPSIAEVPLSIIATRQDVVTLSR